MLWNIVKKFTFKLLWNGSCFAFMFMMPIMFEVLTEQEAVLDKIQRDDMIAQAADFNPMGGAAPDQPIVRPF
jgi:Sec-independent protein secretion pathway component TatC